MIKIIMKERRRFKRFKVSLRVEFVLDADMEFPRRGETIDFSREGMRIFLPSTAFSKDERIPLKVYLPNRALPIFLEGRVKWIKAKEGMWEIGFKIEEIDPKDKSEILEYAYKLWRERI